MKLKTFFTSLTAMVLAQTTVSATEPVTIPAVQSWKASEKSAPLHFRVESISTAPKNVELGPLTALLTSEFNAKLIKTAANNNHLVLKLSDNAILKTSGSYQLTVADNVTITAADPVGLYYATRTLHQLMRQGALQRGTITDSPQYPVRSLLLDVGRKFIPVDGLKDWIRLMGWYKMNELHLHLNDNSWGRYPGYRLESKKFPGLASKDGHYTFKEIRELQDFAKTHGVTIVPEIDSPGHSLAFTMYRPDLAHPGINRKGFGLAYLDLRNPEAIKFMEDIWDEVCPLFDSELVHIGTDEYRLNLIKNKKERDALGESFRAYINHLNNYIRTKHKKKVRTWSGYEHMPGTTEPDKTVIIDMWETTDAKNKVGAGYQVVNSSHFYTYIVPGAPYYGVNNKFIYETWTPRQFSNKPAGKLDNDKGLLGGKLHIWNDYGPTGFTWNEITRLSQPSLAAMSQKLWGSSNKIDFDTFQTLDKTISNNIPNVALTTRPALRGKTPFKAWNLEKETLFIANTNHALKLKNGDTPINNLEYPWTASFTITRHNDIAGDETLITSNLATFFLDHSHTSTNKKTKKKTTKRGVACVRANQAPGFDPVTAYNPDHLMFDYQVPVGKKVTLTFVGEERKTSLYVDGKLIQTIRKQMVCPLTTLGDHKLPRSMHATLHAANIKPSVDSPLTIGKWDSKNVSEIPDALKINITKYIKSAGDYEITFNYTSGLHRLAISEAELLQGSEALSTDKHAGFTGRKSESNTYQLSIKHYDPEATYYLKAMAQSEGGNDSQGVITLKKK